MTELLKEQIVAFEWSCKLKALSRKLAFDSSSMKDAVSSMNLESIDIGGE